GQAGYLIPRLPLELAARYSVIAPLGADTSAPRRDEAGGGLSFYIAGHPVKLQLDYFARFDDRLIRAVDHIVRLQLQASF
ncbi:MAG: hypothetical protein KC636_30440, partial [Myxococcales bacterium]|nr:hypothetical protein [Myxococcales bacterium]